MHYRGNMTRKERTSILFCLICFLIFVTIPEVRSRRLLKAGGEITADVMYNTRDKADRTQKHRNDADFRVKPSEIQNERDSDKSTDETAKSGSEWNPRDQSFATHPRENSDRGSAGEWQDNNSDKLSDVKSESGSEETVGSKKARKSDTADRQTTYWPLKYSSSGDLLDSNVSLSSEVSFSGRKFSLKSTSNIFKGITSDDSDKSKPSEYKQSDHIIDNSNKTPHARMITILA